MAVTIKVAGDQIQDQVVGNNHLDAGARARDIELGYAVPAQGAVYDDGTAGGLAVSPQDPVALGVTVAGGTCYNTDGDRHVVTGGDLGLSTADPTNARYDLITVDDTGALAVVEGTPAASPAEPSLPAGSVKLGVVKVAAGATTISASDIFDHRRFSNPEPRTSNTVGDGSTTTFDLSRRARGIVQVHRNGARLRYVSSGPATVDEYTQSDPAESNGTRLTFGAAPAGTDELDFDFVG